MMPDIKPLSDNECDDHLKAAISALGQAPGATTRGDSALGAARKMLHLLSLALVAAGVRADSERD